MKKLLLNSTSIAIYTSLIIILFRLVTDTFNWNGPERVYAPMFGVVISAFLGLRALRKEALQNDLTFFMEIRATMRPAAIFSLIYSAFIYVFYRFINPSLFPEMVAEREAEFLAQFELNNTPAKEADKVLANFHEFADFFFAPLNWSTITLFGLIMLTGVYGFLLTVAARKFPKMMIN